MYLTRGIPSVYYGDEVGMTGSGNGTDQLSRQDMFSTKVSSWKTELRIGSKPIGTGDAFAVTDTHPIANYLKVLANLRTSNPGLSNSIMQIRYAKDALLVVSKKEPTENREFLVAFNNSNKPVKASITTATSTGGWKTLLGKTVLTNKNEIVTITVPALSTVVLKANKVIDKTDVKVGKITSEMDYLSGYYETKASITSKDLLSATFYCRTSADAPWVSLGTDTNAPYSVYIDPLEYAGQTLELRVQVTNSKGAKFELPHTNVTIDEGA
jgi:hypothetical protein